MHSVSMSKHDEPIEVEVKITETLTKVDSVWVSSLHPEYDSDYDPTTGRREAIVDWVPDNVADEAREQLKSAAECLNICSKALPKILQEINDLRKKLGIATSRLAGGVALDELSEYCANWEQEEVKLDEI